MSVLDPFDRGYIQPGTVYERQKCGAQEDGIAIQALRVFSADEVSSGSATLTQRQLDAAGNQHGAVSARQAVERGKDLQNAAGGVDTVSIRTLLAITVQRGWGAGAINVKAAFLQAPRRTLEQRITVCDPPSVIKAMNLVSEGERWHVLHALYGLVESPGDWGEHRDKELPLWSGFLLFFIRSRLRDAAQNLYFFSPFPQTLCLSSSEFVPFRRCLVKVLMNSDPPVIMK